MLGRRVVRALALYVLGAGLCFACAAWYAAHSSNLSGMIWYGDYIVAVPFATLAVLTAATPMRPVALGVAWIVSAALAVSAYAANAASDSSTAALVFIAPVVLGTVCVLAVFAVDVLAGSAVRGRQQP
jgi:hypothetical protein